jgi:hypothetical protein
MDSAGVMQAMSGARAAGAARKAVPKTKKPGEPGFLT